MTPSVFDNVDDRERKVKKEEAKNAEKKTNLTFLGRSCGKFLGADGCQVCAISKEEKLLLSFTWRVPGRVQEDENESPTLDFA